MIKQVIKIFVILTSFIFLAGIAVGQFNTASTAYAIYVTEKSFDTTRVEDDLADMDLQYVKENYSDVSIIELAEYCYSDNVFKQGNYGLYLYVYNPDRINFSVQPGVNVVNMAVGYNDDGEPNAYENMPLTYLGKTTGDNDGLFYKFKVTDAAELLPVVKEYSKIYGERRYDIAGVQLRTLGSDTATDYGIGGTWHYTGYAKGYGEDDAAESTLDCKITELETVDLDVRHTYYTPEGFNSATAKTQDQLNTVYFAVPKRLKDMYGKLSRVQAEWYEYKTKPVFVMGDDTVYDHLKGYVGYVTDGTYNEDIKYGLVSNFHWSGPHDAYPMGDYIYNAMGMAHTETIAELDEIQYLFKADTDSAGNTVITAEELLDYIRDRSTYESDLILGKYASCLFTDDVGEGRKSGSEGKTEVNIWADETFDLTSTVITQNFWEWLLGMSTAVTTTYNGIKAIYEVTEEDIEYSPAETCKNLYINDDDYEEFKAFYDDAVTVDPSDPEDEERIVYLFRFSVTDTYSAQVTYFEQDPLHARENNAYMSMQNVFLDFDIISLTYERNGVYTVIPVVADPIDIFADVTPPPDFEEEEDGLAWWQILLIVLGVVLAVYLVYKLIKWISGNNTTVTVKYKYNKRKRKRR